jgi:dienelactone hydrolase
MEALWRGRRWPGAALWTCSLIAALLLIALLLALTGGPALEVLVRNTPQLDWASRLMPGPRLQQLVQPTTGSPGQTGVIYLPDGRTDAPGVLLVNGAEVPGGWRNPDIQTFATSIADLGLAVYVPDLPGIEQGTFSLAALQALEADVQWFAGSGYARPGGLALTGVCVGGSLALLAAADPATSASVRAVVALDPYATIHDALEAATLGQGPGIDGRPAPFEMEPWVRVAVVQSRVTSIPDQPSRSAILQALSAGPTSDPLRPFRSDSPPPNLSLAGAAWWRLLANRAPAQFDALYAQLPGEVRAVLDALSPLPVMSQVRQPVLLAAPYRDFAFPAGEASALQRANPAHVRLTRSSALDHVTPTFSPALLIGYWRLWRFAADGVSELAS